MFENDPIRPADAPPTPADARPDWTLTAPVPTIEDVAVPGHPVPVASVRTGRRFGVRWVVALLVVAIAATAAVAGTRLLTSPSSGASHLTGWAPADSLVYVETDLTVTGDQNAKLGAFLAHFPGFGSASNLDATLTTTYDRIVAAATGNRHDYSTDIKPWFTGTLAIAVTQLPTLGTTSTGPGGELLIAGVKDRTAASTWINAVLSEAKAHVDTSRYANADLLTTGSGSIAVLTDVVLVGDTSSVKAALDQGGKGGLASTAAFASAAAAVDTSGLVSYYVDGRRYLDWALQLAAQSGQPQPICQSTIDSIPAWFTGVIRAEPNALVFRSAWPHIAGGVITSNAKSTLLSHIPASALAVIDEHELGPVILKTVDQFRTCGGPNQAAMFKQIDSAVASLGGWDSLAGWIGETALVVDYDGKSPTGGLLIVPKDRPSADRVAAQVKGLLAQSGSAVTVTDETYAGATLTVVDSPSAASPTAGQKIAFVVTDQFVAFGLESWVKQVLDTQAASSLAADARFSTALSTVDAEHTTVMYANVTGIRQQVEALIPTTSAEQYNQNVRPYLAPLDAIIVTSTVSTDLDRLNFAITVK